MQRKFPVCSKIQELEQLYTRTGTGAFLLVSVFSIRSIYLMCILESSQDGASNSTKMQLDDITAIHM